MADLLLARTQTMRSRARMLVPRGLSPQKAMVSAPTVSSSASATLARQWPTAHGDGFYASKPSGLFRWTRCQPSDALAASIPAIATVTSGLAGKTLTPSVGLLFRLYGSAFEVQFGSTVSQQFLVKVDDEYVSLTPHQVVSGTPYWKFDFGSVASRRVEIITYNMVPLNIWTSSADMVGPAAVRGPRAICFGDSFTAISPSGWWLAYGDALGWDDVWSSGVGGTGWKATNSGVSKKFYDRLASDVVAYAPDVVTIFGMTNDGGYTPSTDIYAEALASFQYLKSALPNALICAGPNAQGGWSYSAMGYAYIANMKAMAQAAADAGVLWLPLMEVPLFGAVSAQSGLVASTGGASGGGTIRIDFVPPNGATLEIGSGATLERVVVKSNSQISGSVWAMAIDGTLKYAHSAGEVVRHVGDAILAGNGNTASPSGWGICDAWLDATRHPTSAGSQGIGYELAALTYRAAWG